MGVAKDEDDERDAMSLASLLLLLLLLLLLASDGLAADEVDGHCRACGTSGCCVYI